jgi:high affinity sulfate transporter 1
MNARPSVPVQAASGWPVLGWLPGYRRAWLRPDLLAGLTLAAYALPVSLAYASLAGLPPQAGICGYLAGGLGYALCGSSRHLAIGPTSAISLLFGVTLAQLAANHADRILPLAAVATLMVAALFGLAWLLRLSVVVDFISESILVGFKAGAALAIAVTQIPKLLGVPGGGNHFFERCWRLAQQLGDTNPIALAFGAGALLLLVSGQKHKPRWPITLAVMLLALAFASWIDPARHGLAVLGAIPVGLPVLDPGRFFLPFADIQTIRGLVRLAFAVFLLALIESTSAARTFARKHRYDLDLRQELLGLGGANLLAGLFQGYPTAGGLTQSAVNERAGARSSLSLICASTSLALVLLFLTPWLANLPEAVLAAVVLVAVEGLISLGELGHLWRANRLDFAAALVALVGVLGLGILDGVILAVIASLLLLLLRTATPYVAFLGRIPGTDRFSDLARHPENQPPPDLLIFRVEAALLYFNAEHVYRDVLARLDREPTPPHRVLCDLSNSAYLDIAGARMLGRLHDELAHRGIALQVVEAHGTQRDLLRTEGLEHKLGPIDRHIALADAVANASRTPPDSAHTASHETVDGGEVDG